MLGTQVWGIHVAGLVQKILGNRGALHSYDRYCYIGYFVLLGFYDSESRAAGHGHLYIHLFIKYPTQMYTELCIPQSRSKL